MSIKMTPFTYKGLKVKLLVDATNLPPFNHEIIAKAGTIGIVEKTLRSRHWVKVEGRRSLIGVKIEDTEIVYP